MRPLRVSQTRRRRIRKDDRKHNQREGQAMNTCKTCKFWCPVDQRRPDTHKNYNQGGECINRNLIEGDCTEDSCYSSERLVYPYPEGAEHCTFLSSK